MPTLAESFNQYAMLLWAALLLITAGLGILVIILRRELKHAVDHYRNLTDGMEGGNLEEVLNSHLLRVRNNAAMVSDLRADTQRLAAGLDRCVQRVGVVRFNPFNDTGGDQSFAIALLDAAGSGVVVSSLFSREGIRVYAKPLQAGRSPYPLSSEEEESIKRALSDGSRVRSNELVMKGERP